MRITTVLVLSIVLLSACDSSKWETIKGNGIDDQPKSIGNVIYFENESRGLVGGYYSVEDPNADNDFGLSLKPLLFLTHDGGKNWSEVQFGAALQGGIDNAFLQGDTIVCQIDSSIFLSSDQGQNIQLVADSSEQKELFKKYFSVNRYDIQKHDFFYNEERYQIKETYKNEFAIVIICKGDETLTDYYFVSFDKGSTWTFLQKDFGDNQARFLLEDKFLYSYHFPFGLRRLNLK